MTTADQQLAETIETVRAQRAATNRPEMDMRFARHARSIVTNPTRYADKTQIRTLAWVTLMAQRGKRVDQVRLGKLARGETA